MTVKELLEGWGSAVQEIAAIQRQINKISFGPQGCKGVILTDMPRGTNDPTSAGVQALDHYEDMLNQAKQRNAAVLEETERMLSTVGDGIARGILRNYYGAAMTDERIAQILRKSRATVVRKRTSAENYLEKTFVVRHFDTV